MDRATVTVLHLSSRNEQLSLRLILEAADCFTGVGIVLSHFRHVGSVCKRPFGTAPSVCRSANEAPCPKTFTRGPVSQNWHGVSFGSSRREVAPFWGPGWKRRGPLNPAGGDLIPRAGRGAHLTKSETKLTYGNRHFPEKRRARNFLGNGSRMPPPLSLPVGS